jgi:tRNA modification GTPase
MASTEQETPKTHGQAALLTPRGRGAVATVHFSGPAELLNGATGRPLFRAANGKPISQQPIGRIVFGFWGQEPAEEVVVCRLDEAELDIHCHGGDAAARRILRDLEAAGCAIGTWRELHEARNRFDAECREALTRAVTLRTATILLEQSSVLRACLAELSAIPWSAPERDAARGVLEELLSWAEFGRHLAQPWSVVLAGRPNVGKSSLINALVGYARSIVFDQPGTTRDVVTAETAFDGWPLQLADTAGIRDDAQALESAGIERTHERLAAADCRVLVLDASLPAHPDDRRLLAAWPGAICVANKTDLPTAWGTELPPQALKVSAVSGKGIAELAEAIVATLVPRTPAPGTPIPITRRQTELLSAANTALADEDEPAFRAALARLLDAPAVTR